MTLGLQEARLNFVLGTNIGAEGKNSEVFIAQDIQLDAKICVKRIKKTEFTDQNLFFEEAKKLYLSSHDYVVPVQYSCECDDYVYIAMPYYHKGSLNKLIDERYLTVKEIIKYSIQFLSGLNHIHIKKLIHFDIKPTNILISDKNEAMVMDFGLSQYINEHGLSDSELSYWGHLPPERFLTDQYSLHYDIYHVGLTLYRLCNGNTSFRRQFIQNAMVDGKYNYEFHKENVCGGKFPNRIEYLPHIPKKLRNIINKALQVNPNDRYSNCLEIINDLNLIDGNVDWAFNPSDSGHLWIDNQEDRVIEVKLDGVTVSSKRTMKGSSKVFDKNVHTDSSVNTVEKALKVLSRTLVDY